MTTRVEECVQQVVYRYIKCFALNAQIDSSFNCHHLLIKLHTWKQKTSFFTKVPVHNVALNLHMGLTAINIRVVSAGSLVLLGWGVAAQCQGSALAHKKEPSCGRTAFVKSVNKTVLENGQPHLIPLQAALLQNIFAMQQLPPQAHSMKPLLFN